MCCSSRSCHLRRSTHALPSRRACRAWPLAHSLTPRRVARRPQSATVRRKILLNHNNIADKMSLQVEQAKRQHGYEGYHMDDAELDIVHVMTFIRQRLSNSSVFLVEFFRDSDSKRTGYCTASSFLRSLDNSRCFSDMSNEERSLLIRMFTEPRPQQFKDQSCNYAAFCEILQPCHDTRIVMTPAYMRLQEEIDNFNPEMSGDSPYSIQPLSAQGEARAAYLKRKLQHKIISTRVSARELLGDYDPHLNGGTVGWMKKTSKTTQCLCNVPGCISRSQYMRGMVRLAGDLHFTDEDMNLLYSKYERNGGFNYFAFCKDLESREAMEQMTIQQASPQRSSFQSPLHSTGGSVTMVE